MLIGRQGSLFNTDFLTKKFKNSANHPDKKIDFVLEAKRLELNSETSHSTKRGFIRSLTRLAKPHFWGTEDWKRKAVNWALLGTSLGLTIFNVVDVAVGFNHWNKDVGDFFQAVSSSDTVTDPWGQFGDHMKDLGILVGKALGVAYINYEVGQFAVLRLRKQITEEYIDLWTSLKTYYHMQNKDNPLDNPDQRIQEDPAKAADIAFDLVNDALDAGISLLTFGGILYGLSEAQTIMGVEIPKFMFSLVMGYAALGTAISHFASKPLEKRMELQQQFEGDFRSDTREMHVKREAIALNGSEEIQTGILKKAFDKVYKNSSKIIHINAGLLALRGVYHRAASVVPMVAVFPQFVNKTMQMGGYFQVAGAFSEVKNAMSFYVNNAPKIRVGNAYMNRLIDIRDEMQTVNSEQQQLEKLGELRKQNMHSPAPMLGAE